MLGKELSVGGEHAAFCLKGCCAKILKIENRIHVVSLSHNGRKKGLARIGNKEKIYLDDINH